MTHEEADTDLNSTRIANNGVDRAPDMSEAEMFSSDVFSIPETKPKKNIKARIGMVFILLSMILIGASFLFAKEEMPARPPVADLPVAVTIGSDAILPANEGALVYVRGSIDSPVQDVMFNHTENALSVERHVETYVWVKEGENYVQQWKEGAPENTEEQKQAGHENPTEMPIAGAKFNAEKINFGAFKLSPELVAQLKASTNASKTNLTREDFDKLNEYGQKAFKIFNFQFVFGKDPNQPAIGDFRIFYTATPIPASVSILAMQSGDSLVPYNKDGYNVAKMVSGAPDVDSLISEIPAPAAPAAPVEEDDSLGLYLKLGGAGMFVLGFLLLLASISKRTKTPKPPKAPKVPKAPKAPKAPKEKKAKKLQETAQENVFDEETTPIPRGKMAMAAPVAEIEEAIIEEIDEDFPPMPEAMPSLPVSADEAPPAAQDTGHVDEYGAMPEGVEIIGPDDTHELPENPTLPEAPAAENTVKAPRSLEFTSSSPSFVPPVEVATAIPVEDVAVAQSRPAALAYDSEEYDQLPEGVEIIGETYEEAFPDAPAAMPVMEPVIEYAAHGNDEEMPANVEMIEEMTPPQMDEEQLPPPPPPIAEEPTEEPTAPPMEIAEATPEEPELPPLPPIPAAMDVPLVEEVIEEEVIEEIPQEIEEVELPPLPPMHDPVIPEEEAPHEITDEAPVTISEEYIEEAPEEIIEIEEIPQEIEEVELPPLPPMHDPVTPEEEAPHEITDEAPVTISEEYIEEVPEEIIEEPVEIVIQESELPEAEHPPLPIFDEMAVPEDVIPEVVEEAAPVRMDVPPPPPEHDELEDYTEIVVEEVPQVEPEELPPLPVFDEEAFEAVADEEETEETTYTAAPHEPPPLPDDEDDMPIEVTTEEISIDDLANSLRPDPHPIEEELALHNVKQSAINREGASLEDLIEDLTSDDLPPLPTPIFDQVHEDGGEALEEIPTDMDDFGMTDDHDTSPFADEDEPENK